LIKKIDCRYNLMLHQILERFMHTA